MIPCIIESPFRGKNMAEQSRNEAYLNKLIRWAVLNGYTPVASHKTLTQALDDNDATERKKGIDAGIDLSLRLLRSGPDVRVFFGIDYGESGGMEYAHERYVREKFADRCSSIEVGKL